MELPNTENLVLIRTSFSSDPLWRSFLQQAQSPPEPFNALFTVIDDRRFSGKSVDDVVASLPDDYFHPAILVADEKALTAPGSPCLVVVPFPK